MALKPRIKQHFKENRIQYALVTLLFVAGIFLGSLKVGGLEDPIKNHLSSLVDGYLNGNGTSVGQNIFAGAFLNQVRFMLACWLLGLTVIGIPLILAVVFVRGFSLGFTVFFLLQQKAGFGIILSLLSLLPQNLIYVPILLMAAVVAVNFSLYIVRARHYSSTPLGIGLMGYTLLMLVLTILVALGAFLEAYLVPWLLSTLLK